jgi:calcium-dependent protein kinase
VESEDNVEYVAKVLWKSELRVSEELFWFQTNSSLNLPVHDNVIKVFECFEDHFAYYTVLEPCMGGDLLEVFLDGLLIDRDEEGTPDLTQPETVVFQRQLQCVMRQVLAGLSHLHAHGFVHRDIKAENCIFQNPLDFWEKPALGLKIIDFDFLESYSDEPNIQAVGTHGYIAPEVFIGQVAPKADIFSAGALMYFLMTGTMPYPDALEWPSGVRVEDPKVQRMWRRMTDYEVPFGEAWTLIHQQGRAFCRQLMRVQDRPSATEALLHPWLATVRSPTTASFLLHGDHPDDSTFIS